MGLLRRRRRGPTRAQRDAAATELRSWSEAMRTRLVSRISSLDGADRAKAVGGADALEVFAHKEPPAKATFGPASVDEIWRDAYRAGYLEAFELAEAKRVEFTGS